jgi:hypothetical protein
VPRLIFQADSESANQNASFCRHHPLCPKWTGSRSCDVLRSRQFNLLPDPFFEEIPNLKREIEYFHHSNCYINEKCDQSTKARQADVLPSGRFKSFSDPFFGQDSRSQVTIDIYPFAQCTIEAGDLIQQEINVTISFTQQNIHRMNNVRSIDTITNPHGHLEHSLIF